MNQRLRVALAIALMGSTLARPVAAEDIDIYTMAQTTQAAPNVLLFIDNSSNWSAMDQGWDKTETSAKCNGDETCLKYVELVFGSTTRLSQGQVEVRALKAVIDELACNTSAPFTVNLGLMLYTSGTADGSNVVSGYIRRAVQSLKPLSEGCTNIRSDFTLIDSQIQSDEFKGPSSTDYGTPMFEAFKYFGGYANTNGVAATAPGGATQAKGYGPQRYTDKDAKVGSQNLKDMEDSAAFITGSRDTYQSPINKDSCGNNYLVVIGNQFPNQEFGSDTTVTPATNKVMGYLGLKPTQLFATTNRGDIRFADEWAQFLARTDVSSVAGHQPVKTFTINVFNKKEDLAQTALLNSMARNGGSGVGGAFKVNGDLKALVDGLKTIFMQINAVNSSFASASLPISVNTQGTYLNQVFIGMFRPDTKSRPRWAGNLKQYQFALEKTVIDDVTTRALFIADADGVSAIDNANTGFLQACARSFWTTNSGEYWKTVTESPTPDYDIPDGSCFGSEFNDKPDGRVVERGGVAQQLREITTPSDRKIATCAAAPSNCTGTTSLTVSTDDEKWIRGDNVGDGYNSATTTVNEQYQRDATVVRPTVHGAVIHSRPLAINYGSNGTDDIVVFYGADDGMFRAVDGNKKESLSRSGTELWAFLAPEFKARLKRNRDNFPLVKFNDINDTATAPKDYFFDGSIGAYIGPDKADGTGSRVTYIYPSMRRGGKMIYAFNATQHPATSAPVPMWRFGCDQAGNCFGDDAAKLGQTWSAPRVVRVKNQSKLYTVFGAGYDACEDKEPTLLEPLRDCTQAPTGNGIFVLDAATGARLRYIDLGADAGRVVADLVPADNNDDGFSDVIYAADTSGNVWRINLTDPAKTGTQSQADWTVTHVAKVGDWAIVNGSNVNPRNRKFLYAPDVVRVGTFNILLIGSGNREKPLNTSATAKVKNRFYGFWDEFGVRSGYVTIDDRKDCDAAGDTVMTSTSCQLMNTSTTTLDYNPVFSSILTRPRGWVIDLDDTSDTGPNEQVVTTPATIGGLVNFSTFQAKNNDLCSSLGTARGYAACFLHGGATCGTPSPDGTTRSATFVGGGMAPSPVIGTVEMTSSDGSKEIVPFIIGGKPGGGITVNPDDDADRDCRSTICADDVKIPIRKDRTKVYRYKKID